MNRDRILVLLTGIGSALSWWPVAMEPGLDFPGWIPLALAPVLVGLSTILSGGSWLQFPIASIVGAFVGLVSGYAIWYPSDGIAASYLPLAVVVATLVVALFSLVVGFAVRRVSFVAGKARNVIWAVLACCFAFGPTAVAIAPPLIAQRIARNDRLAAERFSALKRAVERTRTNGGDICFGLDLKQNYSGPPFSESDWAYISGNYVKQDGYEYGIWCREQGGYTIHTFPTRAKVDGTRAFCTDETGTLGCGMEWNRTRTVCTPCAR
jgi:hypothetical protein